MLVGVVVFSALAVCISLYSELSQILLSSGWTSSLVHTLTTVKGSSNASLSLQSVFFLYHLVA